MHSQIYKALLLQVFSVNLFDFLEWNMTLLMCKFRDMLNWRIQRPHYTPALSCRFTCHLWFQTQRPLLMCKFRDMLNWPKGPAPKAPPRPRQRPRQRPATHCRSEPKKCWPINVQSRSFYGLEFNGRWSHPEKDRNHRHGVTTFLHLPRWTVCGLLFLWSKRGLEQISTEIVQDVRLACNKSSIPTRCSHRSQCHVFGSNKERGIWQNGTFCFGKPGSPNTSPNAQRLTVNGLVPWCCRLWLTC